MLWLNPAAWFAAVIVAAPILVHLFVHRRAERLVFPTLRFITPSRLASMRQRMLDDVPLLVVRVAIVLAAIAALAAPYFMTAARQREWNARVMRETVAGADLRDGLRRAVDALEKAPPARREIVIPSAFPIGSLTSADIAAVPSSIGLRFERTGALPATRTIVDAPVMTAGGAVLARELTLDGSRTRVGETTTSDRVSFPIEIDAPSDAKPAIDAAIAAVLSQRVWMPPAGSRARLVIGGNVAPRAAPIATPWMADALARMSRDRDLQTAASGAAKGLSDPRYRSAPWLPVAAALDGTPLIAAAASGAELIVVSAGRASDLVTPLLLRSLVNGLAVLVDLQPAEVVSIADAQLRAWERPASPVAAPRLDSIDVDDRRWFWAAALALLALEAWMRRARTVRADAAEVDMGESIEPVNNVA